MRILLFERYDDAAMNGGIRHQPRIGVPESCKILLHGLSIPVLRLSSGYNFRVPFQNFNGVRSEEIVHEGLVDP